MLQELGVHRVAQRGGELFEGRRVVVLFVFVRVWCGLRYPVEGMCC